MKPLFSVAEFFRRAHEAQHDSFGLANDIEATVIFANIAHKQFNSQPTLLGLERWESLIAEISAHCTSNAEIADNALQEWLNGEVNALCEARKAFEAI